MTDTTSTPPETPLTSLRGWVRADGSGEFAAATGRYVLYAALPCPFASRCLAVRELKGLQAAIEVCIVHPKMGAIVDSKGAEARGWLFGSGNGGDKEEAGGGRCAYATTVDKVDGTRRSLADVYRAAAPAEYRGRYSVPVLYDRQTARIVNNESSDIMRMLSSEFDAFAQHPERNFCPAALRADIDATNARLQHDVNEAVYRCGFATRQEAYDVAFGELFAALDGLDRQLGDGRRFLLPGGRLTECDIRLFVSLVRFDGVYYNHFKCNQRRIVDYPNLWPYLRDIYQLPGVAATVSLRQIIYGYHTSQPHINPTGIVPLGPALDLDAPSGRDGLEPGTAVWGGQ